MPAAAQPVTPAAGVAASPMPAAAAPSPATGVPSGGQPVPTSPSVGLPAELATLDVQFRQLQQERVTNPFETGLEDLNKYYLGGIERAIAAEKSAGRLDGILALEAEQRAVSDASAAKAAGSQSTINRSAVPQSDDETTPSGVKGLRTTYRAQFAKLVADRAANLKTLTDPLDKRLAMLETELTKANRVPDATAVRSYREKLADSGSNGSLAATGGTKEGFTNSLGMKFVPMPGTNVMFCIHETRRQDYEAYGAEVPGVDDAWKNQSGNGIPCGHEDNHPVVGVSWEDAQAFCEWLSKKEGKTYRLPTDEEWSFAVGLAGKEQHGMNITPAMLSSKESTEYPWGGNFPPKTEDQAGNYSDASRKAKALNGSAQYLEDYDDGFPTTAPVMSYKPNKLGLYDLGGNVWEWCEDRHDNAQKERVLRGGSWLNSSALLSSNRGHGTPTTRANGIGFRVVLTRSMTALGVNSLVPTPLRPGLNDPMDNGSLDRIKDTQDLHFSWSAVQGATKYEIHAWRTGASRPIVQMEVAETELKQKKIAYVALANCKDWLWKVRAFAQNKWQPWCEDVSFEFEPPDHDLRGQSQQAKTAALGSMLDLKNGFTNSLGMKFVPVPGTDVLFCIHETRRRDYAAFANEAPVSSGWKDQNKNGIPCGHEDNHPVVGVSWDDASKFCEWLGNKEGKNYRLPTDEEWSIAVGLGRAERHSKGVTPEMLNCREQTYFPWGGSYPPKTRDRSGNYGDESWHAKSPDTLWISEYDDGFVTTAPVMSFQPNKHGIYDMGGNVWEWVKDWFNASEKDHVMRGGSWLMGDRNALFSSVRGLNPPGRFLYADYGFRCVVEIK
jgi:formylglycine-generating enzyme required for sulfatase activity